MNAFDKKRWNLVIIMFFLIGLLLGYISGLGLTGTSAGKAYKNTNCDKWSTDLEKAQCLSELLTVYIDFPTSEKSYGFFVQARIYEALMNLPSDVWNTELQEITIEYEGNFAGETNPDNNEVILKGFRSHPERRIIKSVFTHEIGHLYEHYHKDCWIPYLNICWIPGGDWFEGRKPECINGCSGDTICWCHFFAPNAPFDGANPGCYRSAGGDDQRTDEDFATAFAWYVVKGKEFRDRAAVHPKLQEKYNLLRDEVFGGTEYEFSLGVIIR